MFAIRIQLKILLRWLRKFKNAECRITGNNKHTYRRADIEIA